MIVHPPIVPRASYRVAEVEALDGWRLRVRHNDGVTGFVDMSKLVHGDRAGMFAALRNEALFRQVFLDLGAVTWPGELDLAPDAMHDEIAEHGEWILN
jgi:Protein of unknown function (DUF2442)